MSSWVSWIHEHVTRLHSLRHFQYIVDRSYLFVFTQNDVPHTLLLKICIICTRNIKRKGYIIVLLLSLISRCWWHHFETTRKKKLQEFDTITAKTVSSYGNFSDTYSLKWVYSYYYNLIHTVIRKYSVLKLIHRKGTVVAHDYSPDFSHIVAVTTDYEVYIFDTQSKIQLVDAIQFPQGVMQAAISISPNKTFVVLASYNIIQYDLGYTHL